MVNGNKHHLNHRSKELNNHCRTSNLSLIILYANLMWQLWKASGKKKKIYTSHKQEGMPKVLLFRSTSCHLTGCPFPSLYYIQWAELKQGHNFKSNESIIPAHLVPERDWCCCLYSQGNEPRRQKAHTIIYMNYTHQTYWIFNSPTAEMC